MQRMIYRSILSVYCTYHVFREGHVIISTFANRDTTFHAWTISVVLAEYACNVLNPIAEFFSALTLYRINLGLLFFVVLIRTAQFLILGHLQQRVVALSCIYFLLIHMKPKFTYLVFQIFDF